MSSDQTFDGSTKPDFAPGMEPTQVENDTVLLADMHTAYSEYCAAQPVNTKVTASAGGVAQNVISKLTGEGFKIWDILPKILIIFDLIQKHGQSINDIIADFKKLFGK